MDWVYDIKAAREVVNSGKFSVVTHGGVAHMDDLLASALLYKHTEAVYRLNSYDEVVSVPGNVLLVDFGDAFRDRLPERFAVLDHHGAPDPAAEPSSIVQVAMLLDVKSSPMVVTLTHFVDLFDRFGVSVKKIAGHYGSSMNFAFTKYFSDFHGRVSDRMLELLSEAYMSKVDVGYVELFNAFQIVERLPYGHLTEIFQQTFTLLRLMQRAARDPSVALSKEAINIGFGIDFGCYAVLAVPELERYALQGLDRYFSDAKRAAETIVNNNYIEIKHGDITAIAIEDALPPILLWQALQDLDRVESPTFVVVRDLRNPGAYAVWRPNVYANKIDFRKLSGDSVIFKHNTGFMAVVKAKSAEEAARLVSQQL
ncbi:MAG: hypothetical protein ACK4SY_07780 [Pyrobaculum sp.]